MTTAAADIDPSLARSEARKLVAKGQSAQAMGLLQAALGAAYALEHDYAETVAMLADVLRDQTESRAAITCYWYLRDEAAATQVASADASVPAADRARTLLSQALRAEPTDAKRRRLHTASAEQFELQGLIVQAAIQRERAEQYDLARPLWARLCQTVGRRTEADVYAAALARFNLARTSRIVGDESSARDATVASVHLLEEAADRYESIGQRERAFDCYQVLAAIGRDSGTVEHALEGCVNLTRILREDQLRSYALREYRDAVRFLRERREIAAAATLCREMAGYARSQGLTSIANGATLEQAEMWREFARVTAEQDGPAEIAENALLAAVLSYAELGYYRQVGQLYVALSELDLEPSRRAHYARASTRYDSAPADPAAGPSLGDPTRTEGAAPDVWLADLVEWEQAGSAADACADIIIDPGAWSEVVRRRALAARLAALRLEQSRQTASFDAYVSLIDTLAPTELYAVLSPLELLFQRPEPQVRAAVVRALGRFLYKRSFVTLRRALNDPNPQVRADACRAIEQLHFPHAFDPLVRIFREATEVAIRMSALRALSLIDTDEAADMVLAVVRHAGPSERTHLLSTLSTGSAGGRFLRLATQALPEIPEDAAKLIRDLLRARGMRVP